MAKLAKFKKQCYASQHMHPQDCADCRSGCKIPHEHRLNGKYRFNILVRPNWIRVVFLAAAVVLAYVFGQDLDPRRATIPLWMVSTIKIAVVAFPALLLCWLLSVRLTVDPVCVHYRSLFGQAEMRWDEVKQLYIDARLLSLYAFIPFATRYSFTLYGADAGVRLTPRVHRIGRISFSSGSGHAGRRISFGSRFWAAERIGNLLTQFTFPLLLRKATEQYSQGLEATFGGVRVSRQGIAVDALSFYGISDFGETVKAKPIPWSDVQHYSLKQGVFKLQGPTKHTEMHASDIPNLSVLMALLQQVKPQPQA